MQANFRLYSFVLSLLIIMLIAEPARPYNPPTGPDDMTANMDDPKTHGIIVLESLNVLAGDKRKAAADFYEPYRQQLLDGVRQADTSGGEFTIAGQAVPKNSFTHFYNPSTDKGFILDLGEFNFIKNAISLMSLAPWEYMTLKGPHPSMADMADWYYAQAVKSMRGGSPGQAMTYLGYVLHYVSDTTVPQHVTDEGAQKPGSKHVEYEDYCDILAAENAFPHAASGGFYKPDSWTPGDYVKDAANYARPVLAKAKDSNQFRAAGTPMIVNAEKYCAGVLDRFHRMWQNEQFSVVVVTIDRVKAVSYSNRTRMLDFPDQADFYAHVNIDGRRYETGVVDGANDMRPNVLVPYAWVFPKWIDATSGKKRIEVAIWDDDGLSSDDQAYISPVEGSKELRIEYDLSTGEVTGDTGASRSGSETSVHARGNHHRDEAEIWFSIQKWP